MQTVPYKKKILLSVCASVIPACTGLNIIVMSKKHLVIRLVHNSSQFPRLSTQRVEAVVYSSVQTSTYVSALSVTTATVYAYLSCYRCGDESVTRLSAEAFVEIVVFPSGLGGPFLGGAPGYTRERVKVA